MAATGVASSRATALWGYTNSIASIFVAVLAPVLGTFADYKGMKKRLFLIFLGAGLVMTFLFVTIGEGMISYAMIISIVGFIGYSGANLFYDSFLTDVTTDDRMDSISTKGFAWGYIGSVVPFLLAFIFILKPELVGGLARPLRKYDGTAAHFSFCSPTSFTLTGWTPSSRWRPSTARRWARIRAS